MHRVAITGLGVICALGKNTQEFWTSLQQGNVGIGPITAIDRSCLRFQNGAEVRDYNPHEYFQPKHADLMDRFAQFAVVAAREAVKDAGLELTPEVCSTTAVITGACVGGQTSEDQGFYDIYRANRNRVHPMTIPKTMANAGASLICM